MGRKADKRAARLAAALEREWWATAAQCWVHIGEMALRNNKGPTEIVRDLQTILITKPPGRQTEVMSQWEYDIRHPPQSKPRSKRGQRGRRWR